MAAPGPPKEVIFHEHPRGALGSGHMTFGVSDLHRSTAFYDEVMATIGWTRVCDSYPHCSGYGRPGQGEALALRPTTTDASAFSASGFHFAFGAPSPEAVDAFYAAALRAGAKDEGAAGPRPGSGEKYYACYVRDPDGIKLECVYQ